MGARIDWWEDGAAHIDREVVPRFDRLRRRLLKIMHFRPYEAFNSANLATSHIYRGTHYSQGALDWFNAGGEWVSNLGDKASRFRPNDHPKPAILLNLVEGKTYWIELDGTPLRIEAMMYGFGTSSMGWPLALFIAERDSRIMSDQSKGETVPIDCFILRGGWPDAPIESFAYLPVKAKFAMLRDYVRPGGIVEDEMLCEHGIAVIYDDQGSSGRQSGS